MRKEKEIKEIKMWGKILKVIIETDRLLGLRRESSKVAKDKTKVQNITAVSTRALSNQEI